MICIYVVGGLPLFLRDGVSAFLQAILAGVSNPSLVKCPSQDILLFYFLAVWHEKQSPILQKCETTVN